jgi:hypothetical protein
MRQMQFPDLYDASVHLCYPGLCPFYLCSRALLLVYLYYMRLFVFTYLNVAGELDLRLERELTISESDRCLELGFSCSLCVNNITVHPLLLSQLPTLRIVDPDDSARFSQHGNCNIHYIQ